MTASTDKIFLWDAVDHQIKHAIWPTKGRHLLIKGNDLTDVHKCPCA